MFEDFSYHHKKRHVHENFIKPKTGKQMLQLRSELPSLFSTISWLDRDSSFDSQLVYGISKSDLKFIEKENRRPSPSKTSRSRNMKSGQQQQHQSIYKMAPPYQPGNMYMAKIAQTASSVARTPSSGISSSSSSENMLSALSLSSDEERRIREELMDPSIEVDLEAFMMRPSHDTTMTQQGYHRSLQQLPTTMQSHQVIPMPSNRQRMHYHQNNHNQQQQIASLPVYQNQMTMNSARQRDPPSSGHSVPHTPSSMVYMKQQPDWIDYNTLWNTSNSSSTTGIGTSSTSSVYNQQPAQNSNGNRGCNYCWESYVKLCNRVANLDPVFPVDGPWNWHTLYDRQGRVSCPRLWFVQLDRAGAEMVEQLSQKRNAF